MVVEWLCSWTYGEHKRDSGINKKFYLYIIKVVAKEQTSSIVIKFVNN